MCARAYRATKATLTLLMDAKVRLCVSILLLIICTTYYWILPTMIYFASRLLLVYVGKTPKYIVLNFVFFMIFRSQISKSVKIQNATHDTVNAPTCLEHTNANVHEVLMATLQ